MKNRVQATYLMPDMFLISIQRIYYTELLGFIVLLLTRCPCRRSADKMKDLVESIEAAGGR